MIGWEDARVRTTHGAGSSFSDVVAYSVGLYTGAIGLFATVFWKGRPQTT